MGKFKEVECAECSGIFKVKSLMEAEQYRVSNCVFCGAQVDDDYTEDEPEEDLEVYD